ncbi:MAG: alpha/beta fold hydrolase [Solirubrobacteraceae bacterium]
MESATTDNRTRFVNGTDGRVLAFEEYGDPGGTPVFLLHGTPGCRLSGRHPDESRVVDAGLRLITYDRPGYGQSARHKGRRVIDCVADIAAIADELGIDRFFVKGGSGGGPHALAVGARLPGRVLRVGCDVGVAPYEAEDIDWLAGMDPGNVKEFKWALAGEDTLRPELERQAKEALAKVEVDPSALLSEFDLSPADRAVLDDPRVQQRLRTTTREAFANGVSGWVDDDLAFTVPWGFDVSELEVPVEIRYGATDVLVPAAHGEWLTAHIPHATVIVDDTGGHLSTPDDGLKELDELVAG